MYVPGFVAGYVIPDVNPSESPTRSQVTTLFEEFKPVLRARVVRSQKLVSFPRLNIGDGSTVIVRLFVAVQPKAFVTVNLKFFVPSAGTHCVTSFVAH
jgi:hypothetical protein